MRTQRGMKYVEMETGFGYKIPEMGGSGDQTPTGRDMGIKAYIR